MVAITYFVAIVLITSETREVNNDLARSTEHSQKSEVSGGLRDAKAIRR